MIVGWPKAKPARAIPSKAMRATEKEPPAAALLPCQMHVLTFAERSPRRDQSADIPDKPTTSQVSGIDEDGRRKIEQRSPTQIR